MHASSLENMQKCYEKYICGDYFYSHKEITVLDIGGANINGSYSDIFSSKKINYVAADISSGEGVDVILDDPYSLPYLDNSIDIIISGQAFEHVEYFWDLFKEMARVLKTDGYIILIAPSSGPIHRFPVDCYRFYPDAYHALAKYTKLYAVEVYQDQRGPWKDLVGIFSKMPTNNTQKETLNWKQCNPDEINRLMKSSNPVSTDITYQSDAVEKTAGTRSYIDILKDIHTAVKPQNYLEIGVRNGNSLKLAKCSTIAIDPQPNINLSRFDKLNFFKMPSDYFFSNQTQIKFEEKPIDLAFIDGMHLFEFALRDFINIESRSNLHSIVVIDDIFPNHLQQASRKRSSQVWTGDVWKLLLCLKEFRPDLTLTTLDSSPTGLLIISNLNKDNNILIDFYNPIINKYKNISLKNYTNLILERCEAMYPIGQYYEAFLSTLDKNQF